jgi:hypothetical protein
MQHCIRLYFARSVARDIGGSDPERMTPLKVEEYIREVFKNTDIKMEVISDPILLKQEYPLFVAVDRAARGEFCPEFGFTFHTRGLNIYLCRLLKVLTIPILVHVYFL